MQLNRKTVTYKKTAQSDIKADIYGDDFNKCVLYIHGEALIGGNRESISQGQVKLWMDNGFAVVSIDYRLAPETKLHDIALDIRDALLWISSKTDNYIVVGGSAGGYLTLLCGIMDIPIMPKALVSFYGYGDLLADWYMKPSDYYLKSEFIDRERALSAVGTSENTDGMNRMEYYLHLRQTGRWTYDISGMDVMENKKEIIKFCPLNNVHKNYPPAILLHGTADSDVPYKQSVQMYDALNYVGIKTELVTLDGVGHGFEGAFDNDKVLKAYNRIISFLKELEI